MKAALKTVRAAGLKAFAWLFAPVFAAVARTGIGARQCLARGFLPVPKHFYQPIFDPADLPGDHWRRRTELPGVAFSVEDQLEFLGQIGHFSAECDWPDRGAAEAGRYFSQNDSFAYSSACFLHSVLRHFKPSRVIEVGSGMSTLLMRETMARNQLEDDQHGKITTVDPFPPSFVEALPGSACEVIPSPVEELNPSVFEELGEGDMLFIDSSHVVRTGGDVNRLYLEILPRLNDGVVVHVHDIQLPYDYPRDYSTRDDAPRYFWTEQYLLQAFLAFNSRFRVLLAGNMLQRDCVDEVRRAFPGWDPAHHRPTSSFYMVRV